MIPQRLKSLDSLAAMAEETATLYGDRLAVADGDVRVNYHQLFEEARAFGAGLIDFGIEPGDRVAIWAYNSSGWITSVLGLLQAGAVLVPINTRFKVPEVRDILTRSRVRILISVTEFLGIDFISMLSALEREVPSLEQIVIAHGQTTAGWPSVQEMMVRSTARSLQQLDDRRRSLTREDVADILFTSGTTGVPKGVVMTHGRTLHVATDYADQTQLGPEDRYLMINPYFHMFGLKAGIYSSVATGAAMLPVASFDVDAALERIQTEGVTVIPGPPTVFQSILDHPRRGEYDLSSLRVAIIGSTDVPVELVRRVREELPFSTILTGYGLTEVGTATGSVPDDDFETIATTAGRVRPGVEVRIVDRDDEEVPQGGVGEILLRSESVMLEYLDDPEATSAALSPDGWLRTGDLGAFDDTGHLRIAGRLKDMYIVGGFNAYPAEIESVLMGNPSIAAAAVIGVPDQRLGEVGMAFVVLDPLHTSVSPEDIIGWAREQMANYKVPRFVHIVDALPMTATGKVHKAELKAAADRVLAAIQG